MPVQITLTAAALIQANGDKDAVVGQAYGELDRRPGKEPMDFAVHIFRGLGGNYIMRPLAEGHIKVDSCVWEDIEPLDVAENHPLYGKTLKMSRGATD